MKYAYPCASALFEKGSITKQQLDMIKQAVGNNKEFTREQLEGIFKEAFRRMKQIYGDNFWSEDRVREYFIVHHNTFIDSGDGSYSRATASFKKLCRVYKAKVIANRGSYLEVEINGRAVKVVGVMTPNAKPGDLVSVHFNFAVEIL